jgi:hypothetical protein
MKLLCAWCPRDTSKEAPNQSHGICDEHAQQLKDQSDARHFDNVPSYVGERAQFEQYIQERRGRK